MAEQQSYVTVTLRDRYSGAMRGATRETTEFKQEIEDAGRTGTRVFATLRQRVGEAGRAINNLPATIVRGFRSAFSAIFNLRNAIVGLVAALGIRQIVAQYRNLIEETDRLVKVSKGLNIPVQQFQALAFAASQSGASVENLQQSLAIFTRVIGQFATFGTGPGARSLQRLGLGQSDLRDTNGNLLSIADTFTLIVDRLGSVSDETERTTILFDLFGRSALNLAPLIQEGGDGIRALLEEARALGGVLTPRQADIAERVSDAFGRVAFALAGIKNLIIEAFGPASEAILNSFSKKIAEVRASILPIAGTIGLAFDSDVEGLAATFGKTVDEVRAIQDQLKFQLAQAFTAVVRALGMLAIQGAELFMRVLGRSLVTLTPSLVKLFVAAFGTELGVGLIDAVGQALRKVYGFVADLIDGDDSFLPGTAIAKSLRDLSDSTQEGIDEIRRQIRDENLTAFNIDTAGVRQELLSELNALGLLVVDEAVTLAGVTAQQIKEAFAEAVETGRPLLEILNDVNRKIDDEVPKVSAFKEGVVTGFKSAIDAFDEVRDIGQGIGASLGNSILAVGDAIAGLQDSTENLGEAFTNIARNMLREISALIVKFILLRAISAIPGLGFLGIGSAAVGAAAGGASPVAGGFASGGEIRGPAPRHARHDNVPIMAQAGEWVVRRRSASYYGDRIMGLINAGAIPREALARFAGATARQMGGLAFADGGSVGGGSGSGSVSQAIVAPTEAAFDRLLRGGNNALLQFFTERRGPIRQALGV